MNYYNTFIAVAADAKVDHGAVPPARAGKKSIALLEYELISAKPYKLTQEEVQFAVHVQRRELPVEVVQDKREQLWQEFFSKPMACMRASPLAKSYGWGLHFNASGKVALIPVESMEYQRLLEDKAIAQTRAMRSKRE
ncbi:DUF6157 family protein [Undibacterium sp. Jales W-56]|uniref:DUF6157 family protein n=1 Tax=Undibacterium sp. Jales W-56 TaxID=2897325 RepID=UPI0021CF734B|nr:DUF6157 family protein [Undibacterium sp. Jales W-56]MCU6435700.1 DUF6157 family protein [Undibacterium sp. Jales W-56]